MTSAKQNYISNYLLFSFVVKNAETPSISKSQFFIFWPVVLVTYSVFRCQRKYFVRQKVKDFIRKGKGGEILLQGVFSCLFGIISSYYKLCT